MPEKTYRRRLVCEMFCPYSVPRAQCPLQAVCAVRLARAQTVTSRFLETEIHVESVAFVIGVRRFRYVLAI